MAFIKSSTPAQGTPARGAYRPSTGGARQGAGRKREVVYSTGLFAPTNAESKSLGSVKVAEDITIPAGSYINLYNFDSEVANGKTAPAYKLMIVAGQAKA